MGAQKMNKQTKNHFLKGVLLWTENFDELGVELFQNWGDRSLFVTGGGDFSNIHPLNQIMHSPSFRYGSTLMLYSRCLQVA